MCQDLPAVIARITEFPFLSFAHTDGAATWLLSCSQADLETLQQALRAGVLTPASTVTAAPVDSAAPNVDLAQPQVNPDR